MDSVSNLTRTDPKSYSKLMQSLKTENKNETKAIIEITPDGKVTIAGNLSADIDLRKALNGKLIEEWYCG